MKRMTAALMILLLGITLATASGQKDAAASGDAAAPVVLKFATYAKQAAQDETKKLIELVKQETGYDIELVILPEQTDNQMDKLLISLMAGDSFDIVYDAYPNMKMYYNADVIEPLDQLASSAGYDMEGVFGKYLPKFDGQVYGLPAFVDIWITLYNKGLFDAAGVPYPSADSWTWDQYIETARKLTDADKGIYGSYMLDYNNYNYMLAAQKQVPYYKADGSSNLDDPAFADAMAFFYGLGNEENIQPDFLTFRSKQLPWDGFTTGEYAMFVCGGWTTYLMSEQTEYPRDWQFGILPMPSPSEDESVTLTVTGNYWIPKTSGHKTEALEAIAVIAEKQYTLGAGRVPARVDLSSEEIDSYISNELISPFATDGVTVGDFKRAWFDNDMVVVPEKIIGPGDVIINQAFVEQGGMYGLGQISLEEAMDAIYRESVEAIASDK